MMGILAMANTQYVTQCLLQLSWTGCGKSEGILIMVPRRLYWRYGKWDLLTTRRYFTGRTKCIMKGKKV
jgi:hypothetical protein